MVYESTVYPGVTEEECLPVVEQVSGLKYNEDFFAGYSPERINPGDKLHTVEKIKKVTSGSTPEVANIVDGVYNSVLINGTHKAPSIRVAEASKIIENSQRDVNIAFMNELAKIDRVIDRELPGASRETLLVLDATTGQNAVSQAKEFSQAANITGITLNKLDGTAKGGIVIAIKQELGIPVKFIGVGEKIDDMQEFDAADFVRALFGE